MGRWRAWIVAGWVTVSLVGAVAWSAEPTSARAFENDFTTVDQSHSLSSEHAFQRVQSYLDLYGNPRIKIGNVTDRDDQYEVSLVTQQGELVEGVLVDKRSGSMRSAYGGPLLAEQLSFGLFSSSSASVAEGLP